MADKDVRIGVRLTADEKTKLDEIAIRRHPNRERTISQTIGELITEEHARMTEQSDAEKRR